VIKKYLSSKICPIVYILGGMVSESEVSLNKMMGVSQIFNELLTHVEVITGTVKSKIINCDNSLMTTSNMFEVMNLK
jgi:hypothetical protein